MTFELIWTLWHFSVERRAQCIKTQYNEISFILWGFLMSLFAFSLFLYCSLAICFAIHVYLHVWICMCCRIYVLYTTWFVISPTQLRWTKPSPPNNKYNTLWGPRFLDSTWTCVLSQKKKKNPHLYNRLLKNWWPPLKQPDIACMKVGLHSNIYWTTKTCLCSPIYVSTNFFFSY